MHCDHESCQAKYVSGVVNFIISEIKKNMYGSICSPNLDQFSCDPDGTISSSA